MRKHAWVTIAGVIIMSQALTGAFAENIVLKNGEKVSGKIVDKTDKDIKVEIEGVGVPLTYFLEDIDTIDGATVVVSAAAPAAAAATTPASAGTSPGSMVIISGNQDFLNHISAGNNLSKEGKFEEAAAEFSSAINLVANDARVYILRGVAYENQASHDKAIADFTKALGIDPNQPLAYSWRGIAYSTQSSYKEALADFDKAIELSPQNAQVFYNRGVIYYFQKDYKKSYADLAKAKSMGYTIDDKILDEMKRAAQGTESPQNDQTGSADQPKSNP